MGIQWLIFCVRLWKPGRGDTTSSTSPSLHITDRSFQYASPRLWNQLLAVNHALISRILTHLILLMALLPSVPSTHHSCIIHHPHSFILGLKPSFSASPSRRSLPSVFRTDSTDSQDRLPTRLSIYVFLFFSLFHFFSFWFRAVD